MLAPPGNLSLQVTPTAIKLTWEPPYSLDITDVDPDTSKFVVQITNVNTGEITIGNVIAPLYNIAKASLQVCAAYEFKVSAVNGAGESNTSNTITVVDFRGKV